MLQVNVLGLWLSGKEATSLKEQIWVYSCRLWELLTLLRMGLPAPECAQGQASIYRTEPYQMCTQRSHDLVLTPQLAEPHLSLPGRCGTV